MVVAFWRITLKQQFILHSIFTDKMIFQANRQIKVFGSCKKGIDIIVTFPHQEIKIKTKEETFVVDIAPMDVTTSGFSFSVETKKQKQTIYNCLVGEVFLLLGELNMDMPLSLSYDTYVPENTQLRYFIAADLPYASAAEEFPDIFKSTSEWNTLDRISAKSFSAIGYHIANLLYENIKTPIGFVQVSNLQSTIFAFADYQEIMNHEELKDIVIAYQKSLNSYTEKNEYEKRVKSAMLDYILSMDSKVLPMGPKHPNRPSRIYDMILSKFSHHSFRAAIMYHGESCIPNHTNYGSGLCAVISSLRNHGTDSKLPFFYVQIAGSEYPQFTHDEVSFLREAQADCHKPPEGIYMVTAIDLGDETSIRPKDKSMISERICNLMLEKLYKIGKNTMSPTLYSYQKGKGKIAVHTQYNSLNLVSKSTKCIGFFESSDGIHFHEISKVELMNNQIDIPISSDTIEVRYAYSNHPNMDVYSSNDLPLLPFRIRL